VGVAEFVDGVGGALYCAGNFAGMSHVLSSVKLRRTMADAQAVCLANIANIAKKSFSPAKSASDELDDLA
jgi:hypothetical protein